MAKNSRVKEFVVRLELPAGAIVTDVQNYIDDAVCGWKGQFHPDDPLFSLDRDDVRVGRPHKKKLYRGIFKGHTIGGSAIIRASTSKTALKILGKELERIGLPQELEEDDVTEVEFDSNIIVVENGDY